MNICDTGTLMSDLFLPPTPDEVDAFVNDAAPDAWPRLVDRLLASPLDFEKLTYRFNGRDMRLTDVHGKVITEILA